MVMQYSSIHILSFMNYLFINFVLGISNLYRTDNLKSSIIN